MASYALGLYERHTADIKTLRPDGLLGAKVLEVGPGPHLGTSFLCALSGAQAVAIDIYPYLLPEHMSVIEALTAMVRKKPELMFPDAPQDLEAHLADTVVLRDGQLSFNPQRLQYRCPCDAANTGLPGESFDLVFSHAVFEHVRQPREVLLETARLLKVGGVASHQIDLRNHIDQSRPNAHRYVSHRTWQWMTSNRSVFINRLARSDWEALYAEQGLPVERVVETERASLPPEELSAVHREFRHLTLEDMSCMSIHLVGRKK